MKFFYTIYLFILTLFLGSQSLSATTINSMPTLPSSNVNFFNPQGNRLQLTWTKGDGERRIVIARKASAVTSSPSDGTDYNTSSTFGNGDQLNAGEFVVYDGAGSNTTVFGLEHSATYHFAIFEYNGSNSATEYLTGVFGSANSSTLFPPNTQASGVSFTNITGHSFTINWTNGDGEGRIVLLKESSAVSAVPLHYVAYTSNANFGNGAQIGTENYVVYRGNANSVTIDDLEPSKIYHVAIFEYNGLNGPVFLTPAAISSHLTQATPTVQASNLTFSNIDGNRIRANFTKGNGRYRLVVVRKDNPVALSPVDGLTYAASGTFGNGDELIMGSGEFVIYAGIGTSSFVYGLDHSSTYYYKIFEYNGTDLNTKYLITSPLSGSQMTLSPPTAQTSNFTFTDVTGNSMAINWINGDGENRLIVLREGAAVDAAPSQYGSYFGHQNFGTGAEIGTGNFAVYSFSGTSVTVNNLAPNTVYHLTAYEYNGLSGKVYLIPGSTASQQTVGVPSIPSSNLLFSNFDGNKMTSIWTKGNGAKSIVIAKKASAVTSIPVDGIDYETSAQFGMGDELAAGEFVVYNGSNNHFNLSSLNHSSDYYFRVFEYNGSGANTFYLTANFESGSASTLSVPTTQTSNILFNNLSPTTARIDFTPGSGTRRIVIVNNTGPVDVDPVDLSTYPSHFDVGNSIGQIGTTNNYVIYAGNQSFADIKNLVGGSTYHVAIYEYNGFSGPIYLTPPVRANFTAPYLPTLQASNLVFTNIGVYQMRMSYTKGNGGNRIIFAKKNAPVDTFPTNGVAYAENSQFGLGDELGTGNFVIYDGTDRINTIYDLEIDSTYHFAIFEYAGTGVNRTYLKPALVGSQTTVGKPTIAPLNISVNNLTASTATASWTNGNGSRRIVVFSKGQPLNIIPQDGLAYISDSSYGSGQVLGNGFVMYNGTGSTANVTTLQQGTTYFVSIFDYNGYTLSPAYSSAGTFAFTTNGPPIVPTTALSASTINAASMQLSWTNGGGQKRLVLVKEGSAVDALPFIGIEYAANAGFGSGNELGSGNFVVYAGSEDHFSLFNLQDGPIYHFAVFEYNFNGAATRYLTTSPATLSSFILPVQWLSFSVKTENDVVVLNWETATELDNDYFEVEYSVDAQMFSSIGKIQGAGTQSSSNKYQFVHQNNNAGPHYYRLRQVDLDGTFSYSSIVSVHKGSRLNTGTVFPNPAREIIHYSLLEQTNKELAIQLINSSGRYLEIYNFVIGQKVIDIDVSSLPAGIYYLRNPATSVTYPFVKE